MIEDMRLVCKVVLCLAFLLIAALTWLLFPRRAARERLIEATWTEERATDPRPTHVAPPLPGTFGELLEPAIPELHESLESFRLLGLSST